MESSVGGSTRFMGYAMAVRYYWRVLRSSVQHSIPWDYNNVNQPSTFRFVCAVAIALALQSRSFADDRHNTVFIDEKSTVQDIADIIRPAQTPAPALSRGIKIPRETANNRGLKVQRKAPSNQKKVALGLSINFNFNSFDILPQYQSTILNIGSVLNSDEFSARTVTIEGHADASGDAGYNLQLSFERAAAVRDFLVNVAGVGRDRLSVTAFGEEKPALVNDPYNRKNRRVIFVLD